MKLWVISSSYPTFPLESINAGVLARDLAISLRDEGHRVTVITPDKARPTEFDPGLEGHTIPWYRSTGTTADLDVRLPADGLRAISLMVNGLRLVRNTARRTPPDGIIAIWGLPSGVWARAAAAVAGVPYCVWLLGSDVWRAPEFPRGAAILRSVIRDSLATFANSADLAERAQRITGLRVEYLPAARMLPRGRPQAGASALVYVGRLHHNKGPDLLVEALRLAGDAGIRPTTSIYGSGDMDQRLREMIDASHLSDTVSLGGPIGPRLVADVLSSAKYLVIPSRIDSTPLVLGDAIQARTPILATDVGDTGSIIRRFDLGSVVPPSDAYALAAEICQSVTQTIPLTPNWAGADLLMSVAAPANVFVARLASGEKV